MKRYQGLASQNKGKGAAQTERNRIYLEPNRFILNHIKALVADGHFSTIEQLIKVFNYKKGDKNAYINSQTVRLTNEHLLNDISALFFQSAKNNCLEAITDKQKNTIPTMLWLQSTIFQNSDHFKQHTVELQVARATYQSLETNPNLSAKSTVLLFDTLKKYEADKQIIDNIVNMIDLTTLNAYLRNNKEGINKHRQTIYDAYERQELGRQSSHQVTLFQPTLSTQKPLPPADAATSRDNLMNEQARKIAELEEQLQASYAREEKLKRENAALQQRLHRLESTSSSEQDTLDFLQALQQRNLDRSGTRLHYLP